MQLVVPNAVSAAVAAAITILRRTSQILLFFFIVLCVFKVLINRVNCVCFKVLDYLFLLIQSYEKILSYANFSVENAKEIMGEMKKADMECGSYRQGMGNGSEKDFDKGKNAPF